MHIRQKAEKGFHQVPIKQVQAHITITKEIWPKFPLVIQTKLVFRFLHEDLRVAQQSLKADEASQRDAWGLFASRVSFVADPHGAFFPFKGEGMTPGEMLSSLWATATGNSEDSQAVQMRMDDLDGELDVDTVLEMQQDNHEERQPDAGSMSPDLQVKEAAEVSSEFLVF